MKSPNNPPNGSTFFYVFIPISNFYCKQEFISISILTFFSRLIRFSAQIIFGKIMSEDTKILEEFTDSEYKWGFSTDKTCRFGKWYNIKGRAHANYMLDICHAMASEKLEIIMTIHGRKTYQV